MSELKLPISPLCCNICPNTDTDYHPLVLPPRPASSHGGAKQLPVRIISLSLSLSLWTTLITSLLADDCKIIVLHYGCGCVAGEV